MHVLVDLEEAFSHHSRGFTPMIAVLGWVCVSMLLPVSLLCVIQWVLAVTSIVRWRPPKLFLEANSRGSLF